MKNVFSNQKLREEYLAYSEERVSSFANPLSITLTFIGSSDKAKSEAQERFNTLRHKLSSRFIRNKYKRRGLLIDCVAVIEHDDHTRPHIHAIFDIPENTDKQTFLTVLKEKTDYLCDLRQGFIKERYLKIKPKIEVSKFNSAARAVGYIMKKETKDNRINFSEFVIA